jgi:hypothetical protein
MKRRTLMTFVSSICSYVTWSLNLLFYEKIVDKRSNKIKNGVLLHVIYNLNVRRNLRNQYIDKILEKTYN